MLLDTFVDDILRSDWAMLLVVGATLFIATEFGYRIGRRHSPELRKAHQSQSGSLQGALLGLLGLLLGFTFAMSAGRFEARKQLVLDEANGIGTTWLRAGMLSEPARGVIRPALMDYIEARLQAAQVLRSSEDLQAQIARSAKDQEAMWRATVEETRINNTPSTALFTSALNDLIDLDSKRQAAGRNHVPASVWLLLMLVSFTVCWTTGYSTALGDSGRHALAMIILPALLTIVITIIADLDNPRRGLIIVSQQSMLDLKNTLQGYP